MLLSALWVVSVISTHTSLSMVVLSFLANRIVLPLCASLMAIRYCKMHNSEEFERARTIRRDPWIAVLLSVLLPGIGHAFLRKWAAAVVFLAGFAALALVSSLGIYSTSGATLLRVFALIHICSIVRSPMAERWRPSKFWIGTLVCLLATRNSVIPETKGQFIMESLGPASGPSMAPAVPDRSIVIADKITYRWRSPAVGDIVVFSLKENDPSGRPVWPIKRVVAVGGETVHINKGKVYVDGRERKFAIGAYDRSGRGQAMPVDFQNSPYLVYGIAQPYRVPKGHYFVLGDKRWCSVDSRYYGAIQEDRIFARVAKVIRIPYRSRRASDLRAER